MEVTFQAALDVADVSPAAMDARITQEEVGQVRVYGADFIANRCADLATVGDVTHVSRANQRVILPATARYTAGSRSRAVNKGFAPGRIGHRPAAVRGIDTDVGLAGIHHGADIDNVVHIRRASHCDSAQVCRHRSVRWDGNNICSTAQGLIHNRGNQRQTRVVVDCDSVRDWGRNARYDGNSICPINSIRRSFLVASDIERNDHNIVCVLRTDIFNNISS